MNNVRLHPTKNKEKAKKCWIVSAACAHTLGGAVDRGVRSRNQRSWESLRVCPLMEKEMESHSLSVVRRPGTQVGNGKVRQGESWGRAKHSGWRLDRWWWTEREVLQVGVQAGENWVVCFSHHIYCVKRKSIDFYAKTMCAKWGNTVRSGLALCPPGAFLKDRWLACTHRDSLRGFLKMVEGRKVASSLAQNTGKNREAKTALSS